MFMTFKSKYFSGPNSSTNGKVFFKKDKYFSGPNPSTNGKVFFKKDSIICVNSYWSS